MKRSQADLKAEILGALAHPNRVRILDFIQKEARCNCEIAPALGLEQSNLSRHLKILVQAGVLSSWKEGLRVNFKVTDNRIFKILELVGAVARHEAEKNYDVLQKV